MKNNNGSDNEPMEASKSTNELAEPLSENKASAAEERVVAVNGVSSGDAGDRKIAAPPLKEKLSPNSAKHQMDHFVRIKQIVKNAIAGHHTFMIYGRARIIRECLLSRGWCEKLPKKITTTSAVGDQQLGIDSNPSALLAGIGNLNERQNERLLISKMLTNHTVDFLWNAGSEWTGWPSQDNKTTIFNRFTRANFTSKVGLCSNVRQMHWYYEAGIANTLFPRCYNISQSDQMHAFIDDFRLTACLSLLKWLVDKVKSEGEESVRASNGIVPLKALDFAIARCSDFIGSKSHDDIDQELEKVWSHQWEQFVTWYYKLVHEDALFITNNIPINKYLVVALNLLKKVKKFWPQLDMDGTMNIWILKPGNKSRGRGIVLMNKLDDMLAKVNPTNKTTDTRFVIQKYIERPLLIYDTKFDIRQWFVVTNAQPLTLWIYRESYLRFCSQKFSLTNFHESIHLSNNAVQCKYKNSPDRDASLPAENMWDIATFKEYLRCHGNENAWEELIYPGIKQGLVGSLLASQDVMDQRKNSFELYGADFMVMEDFSVWLIEINSHPDMSNSTSVTSRLCRKAMEDTIKVVIDHRENPNADTGDFELIYKQKLSASQAYFGSGLSLQGTRISLSLGDKQSSNNGTMVMDLFKKRKGLTNQHQPIYVGPVLIDLIEELEIHLDKEFCEYLKFRRPNSISSAEIPFLCNTPNNSPLSDGNNHISIETNTITKGMTLFNSSSQTALKATTSSSSGTQRNGTGNLSNKSTKLSSRKNGKCKTKAQAKDTESSVVPPQTANTLMSKVVNLKKETNKSKSAAVSRTKNVYRFAQTPKTLASNNQLAELGTNSSLKSQKVNEKVIPTVLNELITSSKEKQTETHQTRKQSTMQMNQVKENVSDMYTIGLAINK